jgi:hypothetical protein
MFAGAKSPGPLNTLAQSRGRFSSRHSREVAPPNASSPNSAIPIAGRRERASAGCTLAKIIGTYAMSQFGDCG